MKAGLGLIGLGYVGSIHLKHSQKLANARLVAVADLSRKALKVARDAGVNKAFADYKELLKDPEVDAVIIALPTHLHLQCAREAAEAGKHIFLEKPIARNVEEAKEIVSIARRDSVKLMVGYPLRFNTTFIDVKEKMTSGTLGDVELAYATYIATGPFFHRAEGYAPVPVPDWWFKKELTGGGVLIDLGSHMINLLRWYFGEVTEIRSRLGYRLNMDFEDSATCVMKFENGTVAVMGVGWFSQDYTLKVDLFGTVKHVTAEHHPPSRMVTAAQVLTLGTSKYYWPHLAELQHFVNCIIKDFSPSPSGEDGLRDLETLAKAYDNTMVL